MFLRKTLEENTALIKATADMHQRGEILPDTYVIDVDSFLENARKIYDAAAKNGIELYYMLKQAGRIPYLGAQLEKIGYKGAVTVDFKEADILMKHGLHIAHAGHLVQIPSAMVEKIVAYGCDYMTVYSLDKLKEVNTAAAKCGKVQKIMIRVIGDEDLIYSGQTAGFRLDELEELVESAKELKHIDIAGVDSFPCFLFDEKTNDIEVQPNLFTVLKAKEILEELGCDIRNVNAPSTASVRTIEKMKDYPITSTEPGHGLSGTTPLHANRKCEEIPCVIYLSEVSHNYDSHGYIYGGGLYRRGHMENALVGKSSEQLKEMKVSIPSIESIDYTFELSEKAEVGATAIMAFRFQIFVTRSDVCLIRGIHRNDPIIIGLYSSQGEKIKR